MLYVHRSNKRKRRNLGGGGGPIEKGILGVGGKNLRRKDHYRAAGKHAGIALKRKEKKGHIDIQTYFFGLIGKTY